MSNKCLIFLILFSITPFSLLADQWVKGYYRSDGTYVQGFYRSNPDSYKSNNYGPSINPDRVPALSPFLRDWDGDGISNQFDNDDDNDGILDEYDQEQYDGYDYNSH